MKEWIETYCFFPNAMRRHNNSLIEECAMIADGFEEAEFGYNPTAVKIAAAIRALKS